MFALLALYAVFGLKFVQGGSESYTDLGITPPTLKATELQELAQRVVDDAEYIRKQVLELPKSADFESQRLKAILVSYSNLLSEIQGSKPSCSADDITITDTTFQPCLLTDDSLKTILSNVNVAATNALAQLQNVDVALASSTDPAKRKLQIANANWLTTGELYRFISNSVNGILDERYNIQSCVDETSAQIRGQVQINLKTLEDCLGK